MTRTATVRRLATATAYGGYTEYTVHGPVSGHTGKVIVWFPPTYETDTTPTPVLTAFHGFRPSPLGYFSVYELDSLIEKQVDAGAMRAPVVVLPAWGPLALHHALMLPDWGTDKKIDTECVDGPNLKMEQWLTVDVPAWVRANLHVSQDRKSWATIGASAGGWCALMATMMHSDTYSAAISLGGYARPVLDPPYIPFTPDSPEGRRYDLVALAKKTPPPVSVWTLTSRPDAMWFQSTSALTAAARKPFSVTPTVLESGRHETLMAHGGAYAGMVRAQVVA